MAGCQAARRPGISPPRDLVTHPRHYRQRIAAASRSGATGCSTCSPISRTATAWRATFRRAHLRRQERLAHRHLTTTCGILAGPGGARGDRRPDAGIRRRYEADAFIGRRGSGGMRPRASHRAGNRVSGITWRSPRRRFPWTMTQRDCGSHREDPMKITRATTYIVGNPWKNWLFVRLDTDQPTGSTASAKARSTASPRPSKPRSTSWLRRYEGMDPVPDRDDLPADDPRHLLRRRPDPHERRRRDRDRLLGHHRQGRPAARSTICSAAATTSPAGLRQRLVPGRARRSRSPSARRGRDGQGYKALKFDPFGAAWRTMRSGRPPPLDRHRRAPCARRSAPISRS